MIANHGYEREGHQDDSADGTRNHDHTNTFHAVILGQSMHQCIIHVRAKFERNWNTFIFTRVDHFVIHSGTAESR